MSLLNSLMHKTISRPEDKVDTGLQPSRIGGLRRLINLLRHWQQLRHQRLQLWSLSDAALKDIGLSRADTEREARRPFWDDEGIGH